MSQSTAVQDRYHGVFLALLIATLLSSALLTGRESHELTRAAVNLTMTILGTWIVRSPGYLFKILLLSAIATCALELITLVSDIHLVSVYSQIADITFAALFTIVMFRDILKARRVTIGIIFESITIYFLCMLMWARAYAIIAWLNPQSFDFGTEISSTIFRPEVFMEHFVYFSFVTMTTLGYGDINPVATNARMLAGFQAVFGQLYLAILVARLVGLNIVSVQEENK